MHEYIERTWRPLHPLTVTRFEWRSFQYLDHRHIRDCHDVADVVFGSSTTLLLRDGRLGSNQQVPLAAVSKYILAGHKENNERRDCHPSSCQHLQNSGWPDLCGPAIGAASTLDATPFFSALAREHFDATTEQRISEATSKLDEWYCMFRAAGLTFTNDKLVDVEQVFLDLEAALQHVLEHASNKRELLANSLGFKLTHKDHNGKMLNG